MGVHGLTYSLLSPRGVDTKGDVMVCKLKGRIDKGGHYDVEMKGLMQKMEI